MNIDNNYYRIGLDIGSTTIKAVILDPDARLLFSRYERHNMKIREIFLRILSDICQEIGNARVKLHLTGSIGMGIAEKCGLPFTQEVVAATRYIQQTQAGISTMIDIGGEDAKVVFFQNNESTDLRMNGNCAGGTGAFIDQMAILLGVTPTDLNELALQTEQVYPIASRCGVFSKTDIQNLIAKNVGKEDIAASIFHAVAVQVIVTLAHGRDIQPPIMFCGGPLTFLPALRNAFIDYLHIQASDVLLPENSHLIPAWGAALTEDETEATGLSDLLRSVQRQLQSEFQLRKGLPPIFQGEEDYQRWKKRISRYEMRKAELKPGVEEVTLGIDSGSTTTKIVVLNRKNELLFTYYHGNNGNPIQTVEDGLLLFQAECERHGTSIRITGSCSTGYGEDLMKAAFQLNEGIIETIAHYRAARHLTKEVSFILDIGGQDMKAIFVDKGVINRIEINEACSSGCGSFIETFAKSLGYNVQDFSREACSARMPYDLGTRCTVFMNSKVKQASREGATIPDIAAGLSYSVVKNCLYKVLRLKNTEELGEHIVVQGGTMRNDSVVRAFEELTGKEVFRSDHPELMGAIGCALHAQSIQGKRVSLEEILRRANYTSQAHQCHGCENQCAITTYRFENGNRYHSGNRCEKVFSNKGHETRPGINAYDRKRELLFNRTQTDAGQPTRTIGIPRCLNMYEEYPFWHTLFTACGWRVVLSEPSTFPAYEKKVNLVMSDNICFPAKLVHSHIEDLMNKRVERIFMPFVVYEKPDGGQNTYNCPIVSSYSEVVRSVQNADIPIDSPAINFKDTHLLYKQCQTYLGGLGIPAATVKQAFDRAMESLRAYEEEIRSYDQAIWQASQREDRLCVLLTGRPYHADPLIQHKLSDMIAAMGVDVITDDVMRGLEIPLDDVHYVSQWAYTNRIIRAVKWTALQGDNVQCMQMTSFGCGPDAFLTDETRHLLQRHGKTLTLLKIDDISHIGSLKLRVRSVVESLRLSHDLRVERQTSPFITTPIFRKKDRKKKIIAPFFTPFISPLLPALVHLAGYEMENLPVSDTTSSEWGLRYANNEVCYPATLVVGDVIKAFKEGKYDPQETAVVITQTGGQCRASNYLSLIKKALAEAGFQEVPVISLSFGSGLTNEQPGFKVNWLKMLPIVLTSLLYSDCIAKFYYASVVREKEKGQAARLKDKYLADADAVIRRNSPRELLKLLASAALDFGRIIRPMRVPKVGIVGEIYLKFNPFAQKGVCDWLIEQRIEVVPPLLTDFFVQSFVNLKVNQDQRLKPKKVPNFLIYWLYGRVRKQMEEVNRIAREFRYFTPFGNVFEDAKDASRVVSLCAQFGEGWLLPGEILSLAKQGVNHVASLQPFGCIANHIISRGIENRIKQLLPDMHLLSLDFDSGVSDVNITNRLLLFTNNLR